MDLVFVIEKESFGFLKVESKTPDNIWSVTGHASTKIDIGAELFCNPTHYGDSSKRFTVKNIFANEKSINSLPLGWNGQLNLHLQGPEGVDLEDWSELYPKIPGIERLSDGFWKVHGKATTEIKLNDSIFFGAVVKKDREFIVDNLKPTILLVVEGILVDGELAAKITLGQEGFLILKGGSVPNIEDAYLLCW